MLVVACDSEWLVDGQIVLRTLNAEIKCSQNARSSTASCARYLVTKVATFASRFADYPI
jgi:hypothetical protein